MVAEQGNVPEFTKNRDEAEASGESKGSPSLGSSSPNPSSIPASLVNPDSSQGRRMEITHAGRNVETNHVSNVTNHRNSGNTYTNSIVSTVNNNITIAVARHKRRGSRSRQPLCVFVGQGFERY